MQRPSPRKGFGEGELTLFKVDFRPQVANDLWPTGRFARVRVADMTSEEFATVARTDPIVIVPGGALEADGPHLPPGGGSSQPRHVPDQAAPRPGASARPSRP